MAKKVKNIVVSLDELTLGDLEVIESGSISSMLPVFERLVTMEGVEKEDIPQALRELHWTALADIGNKIREAVNEETQGLEDTGGA